MDEKCKNCKYYGNPNDEIANCFRYPPVINGGNPYVHCDHICGEFQTIPETKLTITVTTAEISKDFTASVGQLP
ncbi:MAG: hypothetical protein WC998_01330 [Candidatus Paceibacterota bacterium]|jgi:hypothetical protein